MDHYSAFLLTGEKFKLLQRSGQGFSLTKDDRAMQKDAYQTGYDIMMNEYPRQDFENIAKAYGIVAAFLAAYPEMQSRAEGPVTKELLVRHARGFVNARCSNGPVMPQTVPDERIRDILEAAYNVPADKLDDAIRFHMEAMGAENFIGWILEAYIASQAEPKGWAWCSGAMIRAVDFIRPLGGGKWQMLQIKNRSNSENSSSSRVRLGTDIEKWFRVYANNGRTNWAAFPDSELRDVLSEDGFRQYIVSWIHQNFQQRR